MVVSIGMTSACVLPIAPPNARMRLAASEMPANSNGVTAANCCNWPMNAAARCDDPPSRAVMPIWVCSSVAADFRPKLVSAARPAPAAVAPTSRPVLSIWPIADSFDEMPARRFSPKLLPARAPASLIGASMPRSSVASCVFRLAEKPLREGTIDT